MDGAKEESKEKISWKNHRFVVTEFVKICDELDIDLSIGTMSCCVQIDFTNLWKSEGKWPWEKI